MTTKDKVAVGLFSILFVASPLLVSAEVADLQAKIDALRAQIEALQLKLGDLQVNPLPHPAASGCANISRTLARGTRGADVVSLQRFLITKRLLSGGSATGFFGVATEAAVQRWQAQNAIVSSGNPASTGFGIVGPKTRAALAARCATEQSPAACTKIVDPPQCANGTLVSKGTDANGCSRGYRCKETTISCPIVNPPACTNGTLVSNGTDANGCSLGYQCKETTISCPIVDPPQCTNGTLVSLGVDSNGCGRGYQCAVASPSIGISSAQIQDGNTLAVSWQSTNAPAGSTVSLALVPVPDRAWASITSNATITGSYVWPIPATYCSLDACGIQLQSAQSDRYFVRAWVLSRGQTVATTDSPTFSIPFADNPVSVSITRDSDSASIRTSAGDPLIQGTASAATSIRIVVKKSADGGTVYDSGLFSISAGSWSNRISPAIQFDQYTVTAYGSNGQVLDSVPLYILGL